jgi:hypothetical protein
MDNCHRPSSSDPKRILPLLHSASGGDLDALQCPTCGQPEVNVWFTHPRENEYLVWFVCGHCDFYVRAQSRRPPFYCEERRSLALEDYDRRVCAIVEGGTDPAAPAALFAALDAVRDLGRRWRLSR